MRKIRIGKEITCVWTITTNGEEQALAGRDLTLYLVSPHNWKKQLAFTAEADQVRFVVSGRIQHCLGIYGLELWENKGCDAQTIADLSEAFALVAHNDQESDGTASDIQAATIDLGTSSLAVGVAGRDGGVIAQAELDAITADLANKAYKSYVDDKNSALKTTIERLIRLEKTSTTTQLNKKADKTYVDAQLALKAALSDLARYVRNEDTDGGVGVRNNLIWLLNATSGTGLTIDGEDLTIQAADLLKLMAGNTKIQLDGDTILLQLGTTQVELDEDNINLTGSEVRYNGSEIASINYVGILGELETMTKTSIVAAINELARRVLFIEQQNQF